MTVITQLLLWDKLLSLFLWIHLYHSLSSYLHVDHIPRQIYQLSVMMNETCRLAAMASVHHIPFMKHKQGRKHFFVGDNSFSNPHQFPFCPTF